MHEVCGGADSVAAMSGFWLHNFEAGLALFFVAVGFVAAPGWHDATVCGP